MRPLLPLLFLALALPLQAQKAFNDSLYSLAGMIAGRLAERGYSSVAVQGLEAQVGLAETGERVGQELTYGLVAQGGSIRVVERAALELLLDEQRLSAAGLINEHGALSLGELIQADALVSGNLSALDKKNLRLELKLLNTTTGVVEGMWRMVLPAPGPVKLEVHADPKPPKLKEPAKSAPPVQLTLGAVGARYFGNDRGGALLGLTFTGGAPKPTLTLGLQVQWMPLGNYVPRAVDFALYTTTAYNTYFGDQAMTPAPDNGNVYIVPSGDLSYGVSVLSSLMSAGAPNGTWKQIQVTHAGAQRFTAILPMRLYLGQGHARPFLAAGLGLDHITTRNTYAITSVAFTRGGGDEYLVSATSYTAKDVAYEGASRSFTSTNLVLGAGLEVGRLGIQLDLFRSSHQTGTQGDGSLTIKGDPISIALLHGAGLEESRILGELEQAGGILIGNAGIDTVTDPSPTISRFLSRNSLQLTLAYRFG